MIHRHMGTITFGTCLAIFAHIHTHMHTRILTWHAHCGAALPSSPYGGGALLLSHIFQRGASELPWRGGGGGVDSGVWEGVLFFVSQVVFSWILLMLMTKCNLEVARMPCNAMQCCGVLWSP